MDFSFIIVSVISGVLAVMGVGGGSIFVLLSTLLCSFGQKEAQAYNLILFLIAGSVATFKNLKEGKFEKKLFLKIIVFTCIGSTLGVFFASVFDEEKVKFYFYIFLALLGIYEIFSSLKKIKKGKILVGERS